MHILLIWKTDKVFALVYVYILNMRIGLPLVIPNNEMTFSSFQNIFSSGRAEIYYWIVLQFFPT